MLMRDDADYRGWLLIVAALTLGFSWSLAVDAVLKPAVVVAVYLWLAWTMAVPARWREIMKPGGSARSGDGEPIAMGAVGGRR